MQIFMNSVKKDEDKVTPWLLALPQVCHMLDSNLVAYERHPPVVGPGEGRDRGAPVVDELDAPPPLVLNPHEDDPGGVTRGQLLVGFVPFDHSYLGVCNVRLL